MSLGMIAPDKGVAAIRTAVAVIVIRMRCYFIEATLRALGRNHYETINMFCRVLPFEELGGRSFFELGRGRKS